MTGVCFHRGPKVTVPGLASHSSCRHPRRSSSLHQGRSQNQETLSSMWLEPLTCSVSLTLFGCSSGLSLMLSCWEASDWIFASLFFFPFLLAACEGGVRSEFILAFLSHRMVRKNCSSVEQSVAVGFQEDMGTLNTLMIVVKTGCHSIWS